jgi:hypothetical protein
MDTFEKYLEALQNFYRVCDKWAYIGVDENYIKNGLIDYFNGDKKPFFGIFHKYKDTPIYDQATQELADAAELIWLQVKKNTQKVADHFDQEMEINTNM